MVRIFISHSSKDVGFVLTHIKPACDRAGVSAWCSATDIPMAADWERQIRTALGEADWFVVVLSPDAQRSDWVQSETHWALEHMRGRVIPVMARNCDPCELHLRLGTIQYIDFRSDPERAAAHLLSLITGEKRNPDLTTRLQLHAAGLEQATVIHEARQADIRLFIQLSTGPGVERSLHVHRSATIGRADDADLQVADDCVSRKHAKLTVIRADHGYWVTLTDLGSANGTFVNHSRILFEHRIAAGDLIEMGSTRIQLRTIEGLPTTAT